MKRILLMLFVGVSLLFTTHTNTEAQQLSVVPYPSSVKIQEGKSFKFGKNVSISCPDIFTPIAKLISKDLNELTNINTIDSRRKNYIQLIKDPQLGKEEYTLVVDKYGADIRASNYKSMSMACTTLLQMINTEGEIPYCSIHDKPAFGYRCFMLDVARQWVEYPTIKQIVDLCRWYKINYLQLHLTDDQQFTFQSKIYPKLASKDKSYSQEQLKELVAYAEERGVTIIPEFDLPGHSSTMRRNMPELFGKDEYSVIDLANPEVLKAVKRITREMMDVFYTSEYFHIGADEAWLGNYEKLEHVQQCVKDKGFDYAHDLYLEFIVNMHEYVKSQGKQTLVWESFSGTGSAKIQVPKDIIVMAWETLYQRPESLLANGYTIINSTWKPNYTTPGIRWSAEYIYNWNARRWENHWDATPSYKNPIQLTDKDPIMGIQMNAWEMIDHEQYITAHARIAAFSETAWNNTNKTPYSKYANRFSVTDTKISSLVFPATIETNGFKQADTKGLDDNMLNYFTKKGLVKITPNNKDNYICYTTDNSLPNTSSQRLNSELTITKDMIVKYAMFNPNGELVGYKSVNYVHVPIDVAHEGNYSDVLNPNTQHLKLEFGNNLTINLTNGLEEGDIYFTLDGSTPNPTNEKYTKAITINDSLRLRARIYVNGKAIGKEYNCEYFKTDK